MNFLQKISITGIALALTACSTSQIGGIDYKSARRGNSLETPPDLTRTTSSPRYSVPGSASAVAYTQGQTSQPVATAVSAIGDITIKRDGNQRWLHVSRTPNQLWEPIKAFWEENGFVLAVDDRKVGVMETDWAENRANIPLDPLRNLLGKALDSLYSTGQMDKFRTRLETSANGGTDIFISQRGMEEVFTSKDQSTTSWQQRPNDPELENEFLRRLMIALGSSKERADAAIQQSKMEAKNAPAPAKTNVQKDLTQDTLTLQETMPRAWRRVGLSLDRSGFTVEDRDQTQGIYHVRYVPFVSEPKKSEGWLDNLFSFGSSKEQKPVRYQIQLQSQGAAATSVRVLSENGQPAPVSDSSSILKVLANDLHKSSQ